MEHRILQSYVTDFSSSAQIKNLPDFKKFEYFTNYSIISNIHPEAFTEIGDLAAVDVDESGTFGIDAIAIIVNNNIVQCVDDIDIMAKSNHIDVAVQFIQSKTSKSIESGDVLKFMEAVKTFLSNLSDGGDQEALERQRELLQYIFEPKIAKLHSKSSPKCHMAFSYTGSHQVDDFIDNVVKGRCQELKNSIPDFKEFDFDFYNAERLIDTYKQVENQFEVEIRFKNNLPLDTIAGVEQAYIGYINASEFLKLITDPKDQIRRNVFYDNVRDFQGIENSVNNEINETISSAEQVDKFILFNNGVTAVAGLVKNLGANRFLLRNYQIVNGCQTSNVLYINRKAEHIDSISIPIKIVHTNESEVVGAIIKANNRQTPIPNEAFVALQDWHKRLQEYISVESRRIGDILFYERRSKEFTLLEQAPEKKRIIGLHSLIRSYTSTVLQKPHSVIANNPNEILRSRAGQLFAADHGHGLYFASALLLYKIGEHLGSMPKDGFTYRHRYHIAMLFCVEVANFQSLPLPNSKAATKLADEMISKIMNADIFSENVKNIAAFVKLRHSDFKKANGFTPRNPPMRSADFTDFLIGSFVNSQ